MVMDKDEDEVLMVRRVEDGLGLPSRAGGAKDTARFSIRFTVVTSYVVTPGRLVVTDLSSNWNRSRRPSIPGRPRVP